MKNETASGNMLDAKQIIPARHSRLWLESFETKRDREREREREREICDTRTRMTRSAPI
jgi:hypothetical protein